MSITVERHSTPDAHYTLISNVFLRAKVKPTAFRVACYVLSHETRFILTQERIGKALGLARNTVAAALDELEEQGYLFRGEVRNAEGHKIGSRLVLSDRGFSDDDRAALCAKFEPRGDDSMLKNCADPCSKIEQHKKTISKKTKETSELEGEHRADVEELCAALSSMMVENGCKRPNITKRWKDAARLLIDLDERPMAEVVSVLTWSQRDEFWRGVIRSMPKFREKYDTLRLQSEGKRQQVAAAPEVMDWLREQWSTANAKAVGDRSGIHPPHFDPPGDLETGEQISTWYRNAKRQWISEHIEECRDAIMSREGVAA